MFPSEPNRLEAVFVQRNSGNTHYDQINISGSDTIVYLDGSGRINADKISVWANNYGLGNTTPSTTISCSYLSGSNAIVENVTVSSTLSPMTDVSVSLGSPSNRFSDLYAEQTTVGAFFEVGLRTEGIGVHPTGTVVSWKNGKLVPCDIEEDELVMGVVREGKDEPIILGAETILVTGVVDEGDYIVTSNKYGHGKAVKRGTIFKKDLFGKVIAQALESSNCESKLIKAMIRKM